MKSVSQIFQKFRQKGFALGAFNFSNCEQLRAICEAASELKTPVIAATSEGESNFIGLKQAVALVKAWRRELFPEPIRGVYPEFIEGLILHFDHGKSFESIKAAIDAGYDSVHFDGSGLALEENIKITKQVVDYAREAGKEKTALCHFEPRPKPAPVQAGVHRGRLVSCHPEFAAPDLPERNSGGRVSGSSRAVCFIEGELGYLRGSSAPGQKVELEPGDLTDPKTAARFVKETGVDSLAIAIGNIHGISIRGQNPHLDLDRLQKIAQAVKIPLVLHGGSGTPDQDIKKAIKLGIAKININTELRVAYTQALKKSLADAPDQTTPYKLMASVVEAVKQVVKQKIKLFFL